VPALDLFEEGDDLSGGFGFGCDEGLELLEQIGRLEGLDEFRG
jgi:hypothetical protein